jgi:hypothetical protein
VHSCPHAAHGHRGGCARAICLEPVEQRPQRSDAAVARNLQGKVVVVTGHVAEHPGGRLERAGFAELQADMAAASSWRS